MPKIDYELTDFKGIHTAQGKVPAGHTYAHDLLNLRIDKEGWLSPRSRITDFPIGDDVTGIATSPTHIFTLRTDGTLWVRDKNNVRYAVKTQPRTATLFEREVEEATEALFVTTGVDTSDDVQPQDLNNVLAYFEGRISLASFGDYVVITSEGEDQGVWVDMSQDLPVVPKVYQLGISHTPDVPAAPRLKNRESKLVEKNAWLNQDFLAIDDTFPILQVGVSYYYTYTYVRKGKKPFDGMESQPHAYHRVNIPRKERVWPDPDDPLQNRFWLAGDNFPNDPGDVIEARITDAAITLENIVHSEDEQVTGMNIYRSVAIPAPDPFLPGDPDVTVYNEYETENSGNNIPIYQYYTEPPEDPLPFRHIGYVPKGQTTFDDNALDYIISENTFEEEIPTDYAALAGQTIATTSSTAAIGTALGGPKGGVIGTKVGLILSGISFVGGVVNSFDNWVTEDYTREDIRNVQFWQDGIILNTYNQRLPPKVKQIVVYNDNIFGATGEELVYSDTRYGNPAHWAFPEVNKIRLQGEVTFCATTLGELRGRTNVLLFGSQNQMARLSGANKADYAVDIIGHQGPVSPHAWTSQSGAIAYVGESGLFLTSGAQIQMISDIALDAFFQDKKILDGSVMFFQDNDMLFSVHTENENLAFKFEDGAWSRWDNIKMIQTAQIVADNETYELFINENNRIQRILWNDTETEDNAWLFESQLLDFGGQTSNRRKRFSQLQLIANTEEDELTLETWIDDETEPVTRTFTPRDDLYPSRVPIQRVGRRLRFRVSGNREITIQGLKLGVIL